MNFVFDIDGTICFNGQFLTPEMIAALKSIEAGGHQLYFASARPIRDLWPVIPDFTANYLIGGNGSIISDNEEIQVIDPLSNEEYHAIVSVIEDYDLTYIVDDKFNYASNVTPAHSIYSQLDPDHLARKIALEEIYQPIKVILFNIPAEVFAGVEARLLKIDSELSLKSHLEQRNIDITKEKINKYSTLVLKIGSEDYYAFGNDSNDVEMLSHAQKSFFVNTAEAARELDLTPTRCLESNVAAVVSAIETLI
ncbi:HAD-IIB family hydrolase [Vagococcus silagei]|uniref:HAD family phosphatase n=1 Tax=Vagococcus silagei TaxID=2508885 RepID=A0A4S3B650_9ENTE|nr:HAD-IIB family hydrolase [Vagococcus silagei]THB60055.1 HAD family phosphatase [Vagococcus silagei]